MEVHNPEIISGIIFNGAAGNAGDLLSKEGWVALSNMLGALAPQIGDIKTSFALSDHRGWYRLYGGRVVSSLPEPAQSNARSLGFSFQLPWGDAGSDPENHVAGMKMIGIAYGGTPSYFIYLG